SLADLISVLIVVQTMFQFAAQCIAVMLIRRTNTGAQRFRMPLYPLPALVALAGWIYITVTSKPAHIATGVLMFLAGTGVYLMQARRRSQWPFDRALPLLGS